ncbi:MAG: glycosyltransferase family 4 protein, partial [Chloroflexi bacterium]|nr:glycosyltransferase family 4 protein [Chloroflexota bacterium]
MHIWHVVPHHLTFVHRGAAALAAQGHTITLATRSRSYPHTPDMRVVHLPPYAGLRDPKRMARMLRHTPPAGFLRAPGPLRDRIRYAPFYAHPPPDVMHVHFPMTAALYPTLDRAPVVVSCWGSDLNLLPEQPPAEQARRLEVLRRADAITCVSTALAAEVKRLAGREAHVVHSAAPYLPDAPPRPPNDPPVIVTVARLHPVKGIDLLLAALARLLRRGVDFRAWLIGDGPLWKEVRYSITDLGLGAHVELLGRLPFAQVVERLYAADLFVLSSHAEGIATAALEAMAAGLPVVSTDVGGMREALRHGVLVPPRDPDALADAVGDLLAAPDRRAQLGRDARAHM